MYHTDYVGRLRVNEIKDCGETIGYDLILGLNVIEKPLRLAMSGTEVEFLQYVCNELKSRHLERTKYYTGYMFEPDCE
ncbi:MAG: hypothetical protein Nk1A_8760 [Endomicrobiia bacterium]|nr:MAG: hypothetical protein Nk1A_8760 [Endomicrobiia bacterium]